MSRIKHLQKSFFIFLMGLSFLVPIFSYADDYVGVYRQGMAPLKNKSKIRVSRSGEAYEFYAAGRSASSVWSLPVSLLRGAKASAKGIWIYWFDENDKTLHAYFEMKKGGNEGLAQEIQKAVENYYYEMSEGQKARFESYKEEVLKESQ